MSNAKAGETSIRNWYISCDDAWYKSPEHFWMKQEPVPVVPPRMGGLSTDSEKRKLMWDEDVRMYRSHGRWGIPTKLMKMAWKIPQFVEAKFMKE